MTDRKTDLFVKLQASLEATHGFLTWADIAWGLQRAIERKKQETINGLISGMTLADLQLAESVAFREMGFAAKEIPAVEVISDADQTLASPVKVKKSRRR